jgi:outer membrane lipoprotein-sorting protein
MLKMNALTRRRAILSLAASGLGALALKVTAQAATAPVRKLDPADQADVTRVEAYLNAIQTLQSRFLQISGNGGTAEGSFYLSRPGRLRLDYDPPVPILLVTSGSFLVHYDKELKAVTYLPIDSTPAGLLVRERIELAGDVTVTGVNRGPGALRVSVVQTKDANAGKLTLTFSERPFALSNWEVVDAQGLQTRVTLVEPRVGVAIDPALFRFSDPNIGGQPSPAR